MASPTAAHVVRADEVRAGMLVTLPQPPLARVTEVVLGRLNSGVEVIVFQAEVAQQYVDWAHARGAMLTDKWVTFIRYPHEGMAVFGS